MTNKNFIKIIVVMDSHCEYAKNCSVIPYKWVNGMVCELYLNKAAKNRSISIDGLSEGLEKYKNSNDQRLSLNEQL